MTEIVMTIALLNGMVLLLVGAILAARAFLVGNGQATIDIEGFGAVTADLGLKLHTVLLDAGIPLTVSCGGKGNCGLCRVRVNGTVDEPLATETAVLGAFDIANGMRLSCQVTVRGDIAVSLPDGIPDARTMETRVQSTRSLSPLIKEIVLELPPDEPFEFRAGSFVQVTCPPYRLALGDIVVDEPVREAWAAMGVADLVAGCESPTTRAYSMANHPGERGIVMLVVRLALPPPAAREAPPGIVSSYLFSLKPKDTVSLAGPFGHFVASDSDREMVFIGGGAGMAPMRAHIFEQLESLKTKRTLSFWYGARSKQDLFYIDEFDKLAARHPNFKWSAALSEPALSDDWAGAKGYIHEHVRDAFLASHRAPGECEYYLCGPPLMVRAVKATLTQFGVGPDRIFYDDFGG